MTHETKRTDYFTRELHLKIANGLSSEKLAWLAERSRRLWIREHNPASIFSEWIGKHLKNEFTVQALKEEKLEEYLNIICRPLALTSNIDGLLHDGDVIRLKWAYGPKSIFLSALPCDVCEGGRFLLPTRVTGSEDSRIMARNAFQVYRSDKKIPSSVPLMFDECIYICTDSNSEQLILQSEMKTFEKFAFLSGNQEVFWSSQLSGRSLWKIECAKHYSNQPKHVYAMVNTPVILTHVATNHNLTLEEEFKISTILGDEYEVSAKVKNPKSKSQQRFHWVFEAPHNLFKLRNDSGSELEKKI